MSDKYRLDINGLRAWAVVLVVLFHYSIPGFEAGYLGVDIFFVISGYLMTSAVLAFLENDAKTAFRGIIDFYIRRGRRIVPALLVLCLTLMALGWFWLPAPAYRQLAIHVVSALSFLSNFKFWMEAGYFDAASHDKFLLHTWSLSVEWQFYILFPIFVLAVWKLFKNREALLYSFLIITLGSLVLSIVGSAQDVAASFFLLPFRGWELLVGGLVYLTSPNVAFSKSVNRNFEFTGFILILSSVWLYDATTPWPSWNALVPVIGVAMILLSKREYSLWTGPFIFQWLGKISYSLYLWHWPVWVLLVLLELQQSLLSVMIAISMTLVIAWASYQYVERFYSHRRRRRGDGFFVTVFLLLMPFSLTVYSGDGFDARLPKDIRLASSEANNYNDRRNECHTMKGRDFLWCLYGDGQVSAVVIGDSHGSATVTAIESALRSYNRDSGVLAATYSACPTVFGVNGNKPDWFCDEFNHHAKEKIKTLPEDVPLIIVNSGGYLKDIDHLSQHDRRFIWFDSGRKSTENVAEDFSKNLVNTVCEFSKYRQVYLTRPIPHMNGNVPKILATRLTFGNDTPVRTEYSEYVEENQTLFEAQDKVVRKCGAKVIDVTEAICDDKFCYGSDSGRPLYYDANHLSEYGNRKLISVFKPLFD